jgi:hypothetical protein
MIRRISALLLALVLSLSGLLAAAADEYWEYTFRPGDSIWKIAEKYTTSVDNWMEIRELNKIREGPDRRIRPGTRILIPIWMLKQQPTPAIVIAVDGGARLIRANGDQAELATGTKLYSGDSVITGDRQSLRLQFADKSELQVLPDSTVVLDKLSYHGNTGMVDTRIRLNSGSVNTWVEKLKPESHYEIVTPVAITAVRGTAYRLSSDAGQVSRTEVTEGNVGVSAGNTERIVHQGFGIVAEKDKPLPEPVKLLAAPVISEIVSEHRHALKVSWERQSGAESYRYQLASDEQYNHVVAEGTTADSAFEIKDLQPGHYYFRVRGVDRSELEGLDANAAFDIQETTEDDSYVIVIIWIGALLILL